jgi:hypothetical protein
MSLNNGVRYHSVKPENTKENYQEFDNIDFLMSAENRSFVAGSFRLCGNVQIQWPAVPNPQVPNVIYEPLNIKTAYDGFTGSHCFVDRVDVSFQQTGNVENLSYYPRYQSCKAQATLAKEDLFNSAYTVENRVPSEKLSNLMLKGMCDINKVNDTTLNSAFVSPLDFSLKLDFCLNNLINSPVIPYAKTGDVRLKLTLARNLSILFGDSRIGSEIFYKLSNLRVIYQSVPDDGNYLPQYTMRVMTSIKSSMQSTYSNLSYKVPMVCDSFYATAILQSEEDNALVNGLQNERIPHVSELQIIWNDTMNQQITYSLVNEEQILNNFIEAVRRSQPGSNNTGLNTLASNNGWGLGLNFGQLVDLSKTKLGLNIKSDINSGNPYVLYTFFSGILSI